ncbi:NACHT domain-containing protein (plasmid) [Hymenobacter sp. NBH84]|uniref:NACHT domain-containing protein n=1 Tax=Hymenobacter sp. NBH84 TaxID=2596915 RepID=UPI0016257BE0|nr:NACHT domain-containing protein [Hymenobacter sp. NBH84]QNE42187.1 NACHT domain-containing protein [Hymenobacter sp. NBH84]
MDLNQVKDIATIAGPIIKVLVDEIISPKIKSVVRKKGVSYKATAHSFENQFADCLLESYKKYSFPNILALGKQQKLLKDIYIPLEVIHEKDKNIKYKILGYDDEFIPKYGRVLITDTAGMGKSTISKILFLSIVDNRNSIPVLIELRRLSKSKKMLDEIFRQLSMINEKVNEEFVLEMIKRGGFVFLLDGYDEIENDERKYVVEDIRDFIDKSRKNYFIMTSRPEDSLGAFSDFMGFNIRPLKKEEAFALIRKYDSGDLQSELLIRKISEKENEAIEEFLENPLLVSLLYIAFEFKNTIPLKKHMFYRQVYDAFFEKHDLTKGDSYIRNKYSKLESDDFSRVLRYIGYHCMRIDRIEFGKEEILKLINIAKNFCADLKFSESDFLKDITSKVPLFVEDGLYFKWAHKSIQEYFAASFIYHDSKAKQGEILLRIAMNDDYRYYNILDIYYTMDYKSYRRYVIYDLLNKYVDFYNKTKIKYPKASEVVINLLFTNVYLFTKIKFNGKNFFTFFLNKINEFENTNNVTNNSLRGWGIFSVFEEHQEKLDYIKIATHSNSFNQIIDFLHDRGSDIINMYDSRRIIGYDEIKNEPAYDYFPNRNILKNTIVEGEFYVLSADRDDGFFNSNDIDKFLKSFSFYILYIKKKDADRILNDINKEISIEQSDDFLMAGL